MTIVELLLLLLVAGICGSIGEAIAGYSAGGCLVSIALGFIGALLGRWLAGLLGLPEVFAVQIGGKAFPIVWSIIGSAVFVALISLISYRRRRYYGVRVWSSVRAQSGCMIRTASQDRSSILRLLVAAS